MRKWFYKVRILRPSNKEVINESKIVVVISAEVERKYEYGFVTELGEKGWWSTLHNQKLDYKNLSMNDIEDFYLLKIQDKLHHLPGKSLRCSRQEFKMFN